MWTVKKKHLTPNIIWDASNNRPLCKFVNGVVETNDETLATKLETMGHTVEKSEDEESENEESENEESENEESENEKTVGEMKVDELRAYAAEHNIDLSEAKNKDGILKAIQEAEAKE